MKKILLIIFALIILGGILFFIRGEEDTWICNKEKGEWVKHGVPSAPMPTESCGNIVINNFEDCVKAGNPVMESYPRQCRSGEKMYIENIGNELEKTDFIRINTPRPNQKIISPFIIEGEAVGNWFFEGDFPVILTDWDGRIIAEGFVTAQSDWMTESFVQFEGVLEFEKPTYKDNGLLILKKDNPSGLPEHDDALEIPIKFDLLDDTFLPEEIRSIADNNKECSMAGILKDEYVYNENSKTWWIDLERMPELEKDGCNPACVVNEETKTAEVNWRCTGALPPIE